MFHIKTYPTTTQGLPEHQASQENWKGPLHTPEEAFGQSFSQVRSPGSHILVISLRCVSSVSQQAFSRSQITPDFEKKLHFLSPSTSTNNLVCYVPIPRLLFRGSCLWNKELANPSFLDFAKLRS